MLAHDQIEKYQHDGFLIVRGMLTTEETESLRDHFTALRLRALDRDSPIRVHYQPQSAEEAGGDGLKEYPRILQPHRFDDVGMRVMLDQRIGTVLGDLFGEEPLAAASMVYFKPPGARGQALHQDNFFLRVSPGTCIAAWVAIDDADSDNGALFAIPGSHRGGLLCPHAADLTKSFTTEEVDAPEGATVVELAARAGDAVFLHGAVIHGSHPNQTRDRFRRSFIGHYVPISTVAMNSGHYPLHTFAGVKVERAHAVGGGPCGTEAWQAFRAEVDLQMSTLEGKTGQGALVRVGAFYHGEFQEPTNAAREHPPHRPVSWIRRLRSALFRS